MIFKGGLIEQLFYEGLSLMPLMIRSDEGLMLETSALEFVYGD